MILSILLVVSFTGITIWRTRQVPDSMSAMVYAWKGSWRWLWSVWLWAVALSLAPALIEAMPYGLQFVAFLTIACLAFTGAMPLFMEEQQTAHNILGVLSGVLSQLCVLVISPSCLLLWVLFAVLFVWHTKGHNESWSSWRCGTFASEVTCFATLVLSLFATFLE